MDKQRSSAAGFSIFVIVVVLIAVIAGISLKQSDPSSGSEPGAYPAKGYLAPDFTLQTFDGKTVTLSQSKGKPVFLNFWASWCGPCKSETPDLVAMHQKYGDRIVFYGINLTSGDDRQQAAAFIKDFRIDYPVLADEKGEVAKLYQVQAIPTSVFIGPDGKIVDLVQGAPSREALEQKFEALLNAHS
ncbi:MAG: TlpA disulfide reductase family protein [Alicyclobacillaceae bacterium]|nr:TlpA disulfide reductase family protein [Alicyclobacillaceae bacterium]